MDYEVELGMILLKDVTVEDLENNRFEPQPGYFLANDFQTTA